MSYHCHPVSAAGEMVYDCEADEHDGREPDIDSEPDVDDEPSLGSPGGSIHDQTLWSHGGSRDHELDAGDMCEVEVE